MKKIFVFLAFFCSIFSGVLAEEMDWLSDGKNSEPLEIPQVRFSACEELFLEAFAERDLEFFNAIDRLMEDKSTNAIAKTGAASGMLLTYECQGRAICQAVVNAAQQPVSENSECMRMDTDAIKKLFPKNANFSACSPLTGAVSDVFDSCQTFADMKTEIAKRRYAQKTIHFASEQTQGFLGAKIMDMRKKMFVLVEKTRKFTVDLNKILVDMNCTLQ